MNRHCINGYQELPPKQRSTGSLSIWPFVLYFVLCFLFGLFCFLWAYTRTPQSQLWPKLKSARIPTNTFPPEFYIGCASSAFQVEGAWNLDGKGENIWDHLSHQSPNMIKNNDSADVACDSYHKYKQDVQLIKNIGFYHYRFSISWSRVLPNGHDDVINKPGIAYYHHLIDELLANGITPMVTLYHWDLPQPLQELGGWTNPIMADYFENYARLIFKEFGHKVKWWITINEPRNVIRGYSAVKDENVVAPMVHQPGVGDYLAAHTLLRAHAKAYHLYDTAFRPTQQGKISITLDAKYYLPSSDSWDDKLATMRAFEFEIGIFAHPIFSQEGNYPPVVRELVDHRSRKEGCGSSRLPTFSQQEINDIRGSFDFFGLNHYTTCLVSSGKNGPIPSFMRDSGVLLSYDPSWISTKSSWLKVVPWGMRGILNHIRIKYNNPPVFITENGFSSDSGLQDYDRIQYYHDYLQHMLLALHEDECNIIGYTAWSILDNFEWANGYTERFGLHYVNFSDPFRPRKKKLSADYFKEIIKTKSLPLPHHFMYETSLANQKSQDE